MSNRAISVVVGVVVPVLLLLCVGMVSVAGTLGGTAQRVEQLEGAQRAHAASAQRIEDTVTQLRVDQATFVGGVDARVSALEKHHD